MRESSGQTKLKVLKEIANEHQIDWDTTEIEQELLKPPEEFIQAPSTFVEPSKMAVKTTLQEHVVQPIPSNFSSVYANEYDNGGNMQFKDAASTARAAQHLQPRLQQILPTRTPINLMKSKIPNLLIMNSLIMNSLITF